MVTKKSIQRCKELVNNPVFHKPIETKDYSKQGVIILVTKMSRYGISSN
jgi:hypothetical protein